MNSEFLLSLVSIIGIFLAALMGSILIVLCACGGKVLRAHFLIFAFGMAMAFFKLLL